jgi:hypothetical protein
MDPRTHFPLGECHLTGDSKPKTGALGAATHSVLVEGGGGGSPGGQRPGLHVPNHPKDLLYIDLFVRPGIDMAALESQVRHVTLPHLSWPSSPFSVRFPPRPPC